MIYLINLTSIMTAIGILGLIFFVFVLYCCIKLSDKADDKMEEYMLRKENIKKEEDV